uniref:Uncharacterized protein n=1 Tax=Ciona savignyi TaxID=51511 RepID=H2YCJ4_CIOSA
MDSAYTYSTCMPYSVVSPLLESRDNSGQISSGSSSWRSILYPRASAHMNAEHRPLARRSSFCESTTSRGMESYVRYCRQSNRQPNTNQCSDFDPKDPLPSPVITYTRIAVGEDGSPTFLPDSNQNLLGAFRFPPSSGINGGADRRCRGESWYGGFSNEEDSHFPKEELEYKGSLASYVAEVDSNPTAHSDHKFHSKCTTETEPETYEVNNDYGSTDSIDRLYHGRHRGHLGMEVAPDPAPSEEVVMPQAGYITVGEAMTLGGNGTEISATLSSSSESGPFDLFNIQDSTEEEEASHENLDDFLRQDSEPNADLNEDWSLHSQHNAVENDYITAVNADDALH